MLYHFLFLYEIPSRELESLLLIGLDLEKQGFVVAYENIPLVNYSKLRKKYFNKCDVIVVPTMYTENSLFKRVFAIAGKVRKIVNMRWEQINTEEIENDPKSFWYPQGKVREITHLCWGKKSYNSLKSIGLNKDNIELTGPVHLDFLKPVFFEYYHSRDEICMKYNIDKAKKIVLYISSFSFAEIPKYFYQHYKNILGTINLNELIELSYSSQKITLNWFSSLLDENNDIVLIYRPHPEENISKELNLFIKNHDRVLLIRDLSVKQWIKISDLIYTWISTSYVEAYYAKKPIFLIRPINIPKSQEAIIFDNLKYISDYQELKTSLIVGYQKKNTIIDEYYFVDNNEMAYKKISNVLKRKLISKYDDFIWDTDLIKHYDVLLKQYSVKQSMLSLYFMLVVFCYELNKLTNNKLSFINYLPYYHSNLSIYLKNKDLKKWKKRVPIIKKRLDAIVS